MSARDQINSTVMTIPPFQATVTCTKMMYIGIGHGLPTTEEWWLITYQYGLPPWTLCPLHCYSGKSDHLSSVWHYHVRPGRFPPCWWAEFWCKHDTGEVAARITATGWIARRRFPVFHVGIILRYAVQARFRAGLLRELCMPWCVVLHIWLRRSTLLFGYKNL